MESQNLLNLVTISISTILSIGGIVLSFWFYKESNKQNKETSLMQADIRNAVEKLEQLYNRTYTDTFGTLKTQIDAMQKHIFTSSVGNTNVSEPNKVRLYVLGFITQREETSIEDLCDQIPDFKQSEITEIIYAFHRERLIDFDGEKIIYINRNPTNGAGNI
jgi:hypothetical protein